MLITGNNVTSCVASCNGVNDDIGSGDTISTCVVSDNTTSVIDNGSDNSCVASGNSNFSSCKNVNSVAIDNASSGYGNKSSIICNIACQTFPDDNVPTNVMTRWLRVTLMTIWVTLRMTMPVPLPGTMLLLWRTLLRTWKRSRPLRSIP